MLWRMLLKRAEEHGGRVAFRDKQGSLTFSALVEEASSLAAYLALVGVAPGDRVAVILRNGVHLARALCAVLARGATAVPLSPALRPAEIERCLSGIAPAAALVEPGTAAGTREALERVGLVGARILEIASVGGARSAPPAAPAEDPDRVAYYLHSTGSTGFPKRVARTHAMMCADAEAYQAVARLGPGDLIVGVAPLYHSYGISCVLHAVLKSGASARLFAEFAAEEILDEIGSKRATVYPGSAFHFSLLATMTERPGVDLSSLRLCYSCGLGLPRQVAERFRARFGVPVYQMYGATECSSATMNLEGDHDALVESVGRPLPGVGVAILDEHGESLEAGSEGEIAVRGPSVARCYEGQPELSALSFRGGWFRTGDLGRLDERGNLWVTGRIKLMINAAGNKVDPLEVENVIGAHPGVVEAAVVGVAGPHAVEWVKAVVVVRGSVTERELREFCRERLAPYKVPRTFQFTEKLPRSPIGKLLRKDLI